MKFKSVNGEIHADKATGTSGNTYFGLKQRLANNTFDDVAADGVEIITPAPISQPVKSLNDVKNDYINQINQQKAELELAGFDYLGFRIQSDERSAKRIENAAIAAAAALLSSSPFATTWSAEDNSEIPLDASGMLALQAAMVEKGQQLHNTAKAMKAAINAVDGANYDSEQDAINAITGYLDGENWIQGLAYWPEYHTTFNQN